MNEWMIGVLSFLGRTSCGLSLAAVCTVLVFWKMKSLSPAARRCCLALVLIQGWIVVPWTIEFSVPVSLDVRSEHSEIDPGFAGNLDEVLFPQALAFSPSIEKASPPPAVPAFDLSSLMMLVWLTGLLGVCVKSGWSYWRFVRLLPEQTACPAKWEVQWRTVQEQSGLAANVPILVTNQTGPLLCRVWGGYRLLIPQHAWSQLSGDQRHAILQHELAHLRRCDLWKSFAMRLLALPHWFNPLVWWVIREFDYQAEIACDRAALQNQPQHAALYARALLKFVNSSNRELLLGSAASGRGLSERVRTIFISPEKENSRMKLFCLTIALGTVAAWNCCDIRLVAEEPPKTVKPSPAQTNLDRFEPGDTLPGTDVSPSIQRESKQQAKGNDRAQSDRFTRAFTDVDRADGIEIQPEKPLGVQKSKPNNTASLTSDKRVAVIDIKYLFQQLDSFKRGREKLKKDIEQQEKKLNEQVELQKSLQKQYEALAGEVPIDEEKATAFHEKMQRQMAHLNAERQIMQKRFIRQEAELYHETYSRITAVVGEYAKANGIRLVQRADLSDTRTKPESDDPQEILKRINQDVVYVERDEIDITQAIFKRLQEDDAAY